MKYNVMNKISIILVFLLASSTLFAQKVDAIIGKYHLPNDLNVSIYKDGNLFFGKIIAVTGERKNKKNSGENSLIGEIIIKDLEYDSINNQWINGTMYAPEKDMHRFN